MIKLLFGLVGKEMGKRKKGSGWKHPKTGEWWLSKKDYHKYWPKYIKPKSRKQKEKEAQELKQLEDSTSFSEDWEYNGYFLDKD
ncbi:hypothetical protein [Crocosphaera chwakensis]|uniref:Uncharacterized protein n=1 Tax=Crocosphaera chwakensis CCY0110 TaxID=391612 RepID=A3IVM6_9CHRO|nr:hypothetical protein [Crocosphaera chwakensis]EAZ89501.1 hypothetical protein CY0110_01620 [Crocosphaera chwakensis CCY0110]